MTRRMVTGAALLGAALAVTGGACGNSDDGAEKTGTSGVADPANGCILVADASADDYPTQDDLPSGACDGGAKACQSLIGTPCCGTVNLALYDCTCTAGTWSCSVAQSASVCGPCAMPAPDAGSDAD